MEVVYALEELPKEFSKALFLVGPTPRSRGVQSWRPEALRILEEIGYDGVVFSPERRSREVKSSYDDQVNWEDAALNMADTIVCWVPRNMETMPALTTNTEIGEWMKSGKLVFGAPDDAVNVRYHQLKCREHNIPQFRTLKGALKKAFELIGDGALRKGGECNVPLYIWNTLSFQQWYLAQKNSGNRLDGAKVEWTFRVGPEKKFVFFWILHVDIYIATEKRHKTNEVVFSRPDIATVMLYCPGKNLMDTDVVLIREFRSPASTGDGYVWEIPGGSSFKPSESPSVLAAHEVQEETGLEISPDRICWCNDRQLLGTLSAHHAHLFSAKVSSEELKWLKSQAGIAHGVIEDTERTYVEIEKVSRILQDNLVDWSMLGMILSVLTKEFDK